MRYEVDLAKLRQKDVTGRRATRTSLAVTLPLIECVGSPVIDRDADAQNGGEGGGYCPPSRMLMRSPGIANRRAGQQELVRQAHEAVPINLVAMRTSLRGLNVSFPPCP